MSQNIFDRMLAGGIIRNDEMGETWEVVFRAQRLSPAINASTTVDEMRDRLSELIGSVIDKSSTVFVPFHTNFGKHIKLGKNVFINHACSFLDLGGITIEDDVQIGPRVNSIVAAGAVVNKDVPANTIVGGVPAKLLRAIEQK
jgi:acetyltransferase-like isoleucine patch superfamily enzyme